MCAGRTSRRGDTERGDREGARKGGTYVCAGSAAGPQSTVPQATVARGEVVTREHEGLMCAGGGCLPALSLHPHLFPIIGPRAFIETF